MTRDEWKDYKDFDEVSRDMSAAFFGVAHAGGDCCRDHGTPERRKQGGSQRQGEDENIVSLSDTLMGATPPIKEDPLDRKAYKIF